MYKVFMSKLLTIYYVCNSDGLQSYINSHSNASNGNYKNYAFPFHCLVKLKNFTFISILLTDQTFFYYVLALLNVANGK